MKKNLVVLASLLLLSSESFASCPITTNVERGSKSFRRKSRVLRSKGYSVVDGNDRLDVARIVFGNRGVVTGSYTGRDGASHYTFENKASFEFIPAGHTYPTMNKIYNDLEELKAAIPACSDL